MKTEEPYKSSSHSREKTSIPHSTTSPTTHTVWQSQTKAYRKAHAFFNCPYMSLSEIWNIIWYSVFKKSLFSLRHLVENNHIHNGKKMFLSLHSKQWDIISVRRTWWTDRKILPYAVLVCVWTKQWAVRHNTHMHLGVALFSPISMTTHTHTHSAVVTCCTVITNSVFDGPKVFCFLIV